MKTLKLSFPYIKNLLKWLIISVITGFVCGIIGSVFHKSIDFVTEVREKNIWILYFLPLGGLVIALIYNLAKKKGKIDTDRVIESVRSDKEVPLIMAPLIFVSTVITHFFGGSAGREGAALQLGGSLGYNIGKLFRLQKSDIHIIVMAGMSGVFSALFGTPLTASVFAIEVVCVGVMRYSALVACLVSSLLAYEVAVLQGITPVKFTLENIPVLSVSVFIKVAVLAVLCALLSIVFCTAVKTVGNVFKKAFPNIFVKAFLGGAIIVIITVLFGLYDYNGAGMSVITRAINGEARYEAFILKIIF